MPTILEALKPVPGDHAGFMQLFFDNVSTLIAIIAGMELVLTGFYNDQLMSFLNADGNGAYAGMVFGNISDIIYKRSIPGLAITMVFGNIYYALQGARLAKNTGQATTALPYGINTPGAFAFIFSIIAPVVVSAGAFGCNAVVEETSVSCGNGVYEVPADKAEAYAQCWVDAANAGWQAGVVSNFLAGIICVLLSFVGPLITKVTPPQALLTSLAGIGFVFLGINQAIPAFSEPIAGFIPFFLVIICYFGDVSFGDKLPPSVLVVALGVALGWADGLKTGEALSAAAEKVEFYGISGEGFSALGDWSAVGNYLGITVPVALAAASGTLMNVYSAAQAGDKYNLVETMLSDGFGTMLGAMFGTPFGTSVYVGHPAYKKMGAGNCYSVFNCVLFFFFGIFGIFEVLNALIPQTAVAPLIFFVGMMICQEALCSMPSRHYPAFLVGLFAFLGDWAILNGFNRSSFGSNSYFGLQALGFSNLLMALIISSLMMFLIDRNYKMALGWSTFAAVASAVGLIHQKRIAPVNFVVPDPVVDPSNPSLYTFDTKDTYFNGYNWNNFGTDILFEKTEQWRFFVGYMEVTAMILVFFLLQKRGLIGEVLTDQEDTDKRSSVLKTLKAGNPIYDGEMDAEVTDETKV